MVDTHMKPNKTVVVTIIFLTSIILLLISGCVHRRCFSIDPALLRDVILSSNMVRVFDEELQEVLFECQDADEIQWLSDAFIADRTSPLVVSMGKMRYRLIFYNDSKITAEIGLRKKIKFYWFDSAWGRSIDFRLTSGSYGEMLPWLCEKSGKDLNELFPAQDWIKGIRERPPKPTEEEQSLYQDDLIRR